MLTISPILAVISLLAVPGLDRRDGPDRPALAEAVRRPVGLDRRAQRPRRGDAHRPRDRQGVRPPAARRSRRSTSENERLYEASYRAQFISGIIQPAMNFISNLNYVAIAVIGGLRVASRPDVASATSSRSSSTRASSRSRSSRPRASSTSSSRRSPRPSASSSSSTSPRRSPIRSRPRVLGDAGGAVAFEDVSFRYEPDKPLIDDLDLVVDGRPRRSPSSARPAPARRRSSTCSCGSTRSTAGRITIDGIDTRELTRDDLRRTFGMVLQDTWLFHGTIRENIAYGRDGRDRGGDRRRPPRRPTSTTSCGRCPTATTRSSTTTRRTCRPARSSS